MAKKVEQLVLDGVETSDEPVQSLEESSEPKRVAFGRYVKPEMYDVFGDYDIDGVTDAEKRWLVPRNMAHYLFDRVSDSKQTVDGLA